MQKFADWGSKGYFGSSPNGTDYDAAWNEFTKGTGVFLPGGSWLGTDMEKVMGDDLRFMARRPRSTASSPPPAAPASRSRSRQRRRTRRQPRPTSTSSRRRRP
ncbi:hypothetical protein [Tessaracoccus coleopterorum]|uniref:hypothetical protein n=1 Tax=Tessaracoccus coleopterorum TaxID=2714950 RepID=UPI001E2B5DE1|nr:hypothetical protein [Tessaracoccus coleopterorum]